MQHVRLGSTGLRVSRIALGTMTFGLQCDEQTSRAILDTAFEAGVTLLDTADVYPVGGTLETVGRTEEIIGRWLPGHRDQVVLATKGYGRTGPAEWDQGNSRVHLTAALDASLRRLGTDHVDLYQLHGPDPGTPIDETLETLDGFVRAGKVRYVGVSNFPAWQVARAVGRAEATRLTRPDSVQPRYNLLFRQFERELFPLAAAEGLGVLPYNPIAGGLLSGKYRSGPTPPEIGRFTLGTAADLYRRRYWHDRAFATVEALRGIADQAGLALPTMATAWVLANPVITAPIVGASSPGQLAATLAAAEVHLDDDLCQQLDDLTIEYRYGDADR
ncbi:MAG: aldo/keto reductase [Actinomycetes bacterium]